MVLAHSLPAPASSCPLFRKAPMPQVRIEAQPALTVYGPRLSRVALWASRTRAHTAWIAATTVSRVNRQTSPSRRAATASASTSASWRTPTLTSTWRMRCQTRCRHPARARSWCARTRYTRSPLLRPQTAATNHWSLCKALNPWRYKPPTPAKLDSGRSRKRPLAAGNQDSAAWGWSST